MEVVIQRDRNDEYEPQIIKKYQNIVTQDIEGKFLSMYAKGMTTGDIESHMRELYDIDISDSTISRITDKILPIIVGVEDILIACVDGFTGFPQAIEAVYPQTEVQQCIIHQIRNSTKFVSYKDIKKLMTDLKQVYATPTEKTALNQLDLFKDKWDSEYPQIYKYWHDNWR